MWLSISTATDHDPGPMVNYHEIQQTMGNSVFRILLFYHFSVIWSISCTYLAVEGLNSLTVGRTFPVREIDNKLKKNKKTLAKGRRNW